MTIYPAPAAIVRAMPLAEWERRVLETATSEASLPSPAATDPRRPCYGERQRVAMYRSRGGGKRRKR